MTRYRINSAKPFYVLHNGFPINFRDGSKTGTLLDMIYSELFLCMRSVTEGTAPVDLSNSPPDVQDEVAKAWLRAHASDFADETRDKLWDFPESLKLGLPLVFTTGIMESLQNWLKLNKQGKNDMET